MDKWFATDKNADCNESSSLISVILYIVLSLHYCRSFTTRGAVIFPRIRFSGEVSTRRVSSLIGLQFGFYRTSKPAKKLVVGKWPLLYKSSERCFAPIHPFCFPRFFRFCCCAIREDPLQTMVLLQSLAAILPFSAILPFVKILSAIRHSWRSFRADPSAILKIAC